MLVLRLSGGSTKTVVDSLTTYRECLLSDGVSVKNMQYNRSAGCTCLSCGQSAAVKSEVLTRKELKVNQVLNNEVSTAVTVLFMLYFPSLMIFHAARVPGQSAVNWRSVMCSWDFFF